jgi:hypothetical protein
MAGGTSREVTNGKYYLTITKVEDGKVYGKANVPNRKPPAFDFIGTLEGNRLTFGNEQVQTEMTIVGDRMTGVHRGRPRLFEVSLQKLK